MTLNERRIRLASGGDGGQKTRVIQSRSRVHGLESASLRALYLVPVKPRHPYRGDLASLLAEIQIWGPGYFHTAICQVDTTFRVIRESCKELFPDGNYLVGLLALLGNPAGHYDVAAFSIDASIRIAGQRLRREFLPRHHCPSVEPPGPGKSD